MDSLSLSRERERKRDVLALPLYYMHRSRWTAVYMSKVIGESRETSNTVGSEYSDVGRAWRVGRCARAARKYASRIKGRVLWINGSRRWAVIRFATASTDSLHNHFHGELPGIIPIQYGSQTEYHLDQIWCLDGRNLSQAGPPIGPKRGPTRTRFGRNLSQTGPRIGPSRGPTRTQNNSHAPCLDFLLGPPSNAYHLRALH